jgi:hypothetical protein
VRAEGKCKHMGRVIGHCCARVIDSASAVSRERLREASIEQERESNRCEGEPTGSDRERGAPFE